jgi:7-carboxy-7-deazaguanine synthase
MINTQQPEKSIRPAYDGFLEVHSIFYTIQGEGPFRGHPAIFIRLAGCNLQCPGCDTEYTATRERLTEEQIFNKVCELLFEGRKSFRDLERRDLIIITGGEPLRQNIKELCYLLLANGHKVQIETNGTYPADDLPDKVYIVCSPKSGTVNPRLEQRIDAYKYVVEAGHTSATDGLPTTILGKAANPARPPVGYNGPIFVSPMDVEDPNKNRLNMLTASQVCLAHGYIFNPQIHKLVDLP